ncbi:ATP-dependent helicase [Sciscionella marina]|uniref:ATP-dependent helicase n=1 Tax=Sciscionella marina TaxID=508770 RepID=UPI000360F90F|nr:ATP-dependent DNA helicase [Sciscionella marina]
MREPLSPLHISAALGLPAPTGEQAEVIGAPIEPALVVAGAGAGKTETMAARVVYLVANGFVTPEHVLGLTFTRKAARQLAERVRARLRRLAGSPLLEQTDPSGALRAEVLASEPTVLTYNAYAGRLVAEHGLRLPVEPGARVLTETAAWQLASSVVSTWDGELETSYVPATVTAHLLALAGELAEHLVDTETLAAHAERICQAVEHAPRAKGQGTAIKEETRKRLDVQRLRVALLPLVAEYQRRKRAEGAIDFADQMALAARLAAEHPEVGETERGRYRAVLLDEYQDTGHAQRVLLRTLFGKGARESVPVTAVGDPAQSIYGWRGASAANLPRFTTDFPNGGRPAGEYSLLTSFRNPPQVLAIANRTAKELRDAGLRVGELRARTGAEPAEVRAALHPDVETEREWVAGELAARWHAHVERTGSAPTAAVLVRRRADMAELAAALRARGLPVEVVGLGGLLREPEVRDLVSTLRVLIDPLAGTAAARLLTGARWRIGAADLSALWARCRELAEAGEAGQSSPELLAGVDVRGALPGELAEQAGLVDAIDDPGPPERYTELGYARIRALGRELGMVRSRMDQPLAELVADVERTMRLDIETLSRPGPVGRTQLDRFAEVVADYAASSPNANLRALLDYLATAEDAEDGLEPGEVVVAEDRVQVLTVHAAKGLEWQLVAVPHLVEGVFPARKQASSWLGNVAELPAELRGDSIDLPELRLPAGGDRKELEEALAKHEEDFDDRRLTEERRLCYVAFTRTEHTLLASAHWWGATGKKPRHPSVLLREVRELLEADPELGEIACWAPEPEPDEENPVAARQHSADWPADPLGERRDAVAEGAALVRAALEAEDVEDTETEDDPEGWAAEVDVLLAERAARAERAERVALPAQLSVSQLVELAEDPGALATRLRRPLPFEPNPATRRGTAFHAWLEHRFASNALLEFDELPGAADGDDTPEADLDRLRAAFLGGQWGNRVPQEVEVGFETEVEGIVVRGRMDAVFADADGGWTVVDWKTGMVPDEEHMRAVSVQLAIYRLAWAAIADAGVERVRAAFYYVRADRTVAPADLLDVDGLRELLRTVPSE